MLSAFFLISCSEEEVNLPNTLTKEEKEEGWRLLFDGKTTEGWHLYNKGDVPSAWIVKDEELFCNPDTFEVDHGDLVTNEEFSDFDLRFDWKISTAGNSGVFINVQEGEEYPTTWTTGPEYQILDNLGIHKEYLEDTTHWAACLYGFQPIMNQVTPKAAGEWNHSRITQKDGKITYWLNEIMTAQEDLTGENWKALIANSNFKSFPAFGKATSGKLALQDWSKGVSFRNIKILEL